MSPSLVARLKSTRSWAIESFALITREATSATRPVTSWVVVFLLESCPSWVTSSTVVSKLSTGTRSVIDEEVREPWVSVAVSSLSTNPPSEVAATCSMLDHDRGDLDRPQPISGGLDLGPAERDGVDVGQAVASAARLPASRGSAAGAAPALPPVAALPTAEFIVGALVLLAVLFEPLHADTAKIAATAATEATVTSRRRWLPRTGRWWLPRSGRRRPMRTGRGRLPRRGVVMPL